MLTDMQIRLRDEIVRNENNDDYLFVDEYLLYGTFEDLVCNENLVQEQETEME